jgi:hypothetical protein
MNKQILCALFLSLKTILISQTIPCSNFTITGGFPDTINPNDYQLSINFNANSNEIVGYPHVSALLDCNGDTLATGGLFYFGQLGQTTQDYPITIIDSSDWCEPLTAIFIYGSGPLNEGDTCSLSFQSTTITNISKKEGIKISPNPASEILNVSVPTELIGKSFRIVNQLGQVVLERLTSNILNEVDIKILEPGFYYLHFTNVFIEMTQFIKTL